MSRPNFWASLVINAVDATPEMRRELRPAMAALRGKGSTLEEVCELVADVLGTDAPRIRIESLVYLADHVRKNSKIAIRSARWLASRDRRLGVWAALACVKIAEGSVPAQKLPSGKEALEAGKEALRLCSEWVHGRASTEDVQNAASFAHALSYDPYQSVVRDAKCAGYFASASGLVADAASKKHLFAVNASQNAVTNAAATIATAATSDKSMWQIISNKALRDFVDVIVEAILDFPPEVRMNPRRRSYR